MRTDVILSCRRPQRDLLKKMAAVEGVTVTALLDHLIESRLGAYPAHVRKTVEEGLPS